jgi:hypothetical protein
MAHLSNRTHIPHLTSRKFQIESKICLLEIEHGNICTPYLLESCFKQRYGSTQPRLQLLERMNATVTGDGSEWAGHLVTRFSTCAAFHMLGMKKPVVVVAVELQAKRFCYKTFSDVPDLTQYPKHIIILSCIFKISIIIVAYCNKTRLFPRNGVAAYADNP